MPDFTHPRPNQSSNPETQAGKRVSAHLDDFATPEGEKVWEAAQDAAEQRRQADNAAEADRRIAQAELEAVELRHHQDAVRRAEKHRRELRRPQDEPAADWEAVRTPIAQIERTYLEFLWEPWLPRGVFGLLGGDEDTGKTQIALDFMARGSTGSPWPDGQEGGAPFDSVLIGDEDDIGSIIRPRLEALGADLNRVHFIEMSQGQERRAPRFPLEVETVEQRIREVNTRFVFIDLLIDTLQLDPKGNAYQDTRRVISALAALARRCGCTVLGSSHLTKGNYDKGTHRLLGSVGLSSRAKFSMFTVESGENPNHYVFGVGKMNYAQKPLPLGYYITSVDELKTSRVVWDGVSDEDLNALLTHNLPKAPTPKLNAKDFLIHFLADGPKSPQEVLHAADEAGFGVSTVYDAKKALHIIHANNAWHLPDIM